MSEEKKIMLPDLSELIVSSSPHLHNSQTISKIMYIVILSLLPSCAVGIYYFGIDAALVLVYCVSFCIFLEYLASSILGQQIRIKDGSAALTGLLLGMNLSSTVPWWICLIGSIFAIILAKSIFGGLGYNPFNPALVARVALLIGFPSLMTEWIAPDAKTIENTENTVTGATTGATEMIDSAEIINSVETVSDMVTSATPLTYTPEMVAKYDGSLYMDLFLGNTGGCIGETSAIALLLGGILLIAFKLIKWQIPLAFIGTVAIISGIAHIANPDEVLTPLVHILAGGLFLGAFFMATDMVTTPMTIKGAWIFGIGCGIITSLIRIWAGYPEGVSFSILFMNALVPLIDRYTAKKPFGFKKIIKGDA